MIRALRAGQVVRLASGNEVRLVRRVGAEWVCEYTARSARRGEVLLTVAFLTRARGIH